MKRYGGLKRSSLNRGRDVSLPWQFSRSRHRYKHLSRTCRTGTSWGRADLQFGDANKPSYARRSKMQPTSNAKANENPPLTSTTESRKKAQTREERVQEDGRLGGEEQQCHEREADTVKRRKNGRLKRTGNDEESKTTLVIYHGGAGTLRASRLLSPRPRPRATDHRDKGGRQGWICACALPKRMEPGPAPSLSQPMI